MYYLCKDLISLFLKCYQFILKLNHYHFNYPENIIYQCAITISEVAQLCLTLCDPMNYCSPAGSSIHGSFQATVLEWVAISFSRGSSQPRDQTQVSQISGRRFTVWATREKQNSNQSKIGVDHYFKSSKKYLYINYKNISKFL